VAEQTEHGSGSDIEVEVAQCPQLSEAFPEAGSADPAARIDRAAPHCQGHRGEPFTRIVY
jgi:hypothetical protein